MINNSCDDIRELYELQKIFIMTLIEMVGSKDYNTGEHIRRTAEYVKIIAIELKKRGIYQEDLQGNFIKNLVNAAPLHDIGKINTPDAILNKPGKLTEEEFETMKDHTIIGGYNIQKIIDKLPKDSKFLTVLNIAHDIALYHHEKWNGKGYPYQKKELDIPLSARIMTVADVFDALTSKRVYKEAIPFDESYEIISEESGKSFDPIITDVFCDNKVKKKIKIFLNKNNV